MTGSPTPPPTPSEAVQIASSLGEAAAEVGAGAYDLARKEHRQPPWDGTPSPIAGEPRPGGDRRRWEDVHREEMLREGLEARRRGAGPGRRRTAEESLEIKALLLPAIAALLKRHPMVPNMVAYYSRRVAGDLLDDLGVDVKKKKPKQPKKKQPKETNGDPAPADTGPNPPPIPPGPPPQIPQ